MNKIEKFAELIIKVGINLKENQRLIIKADVEARELVRALVEKAYQNKAKEVLVDYRDGVITRTKYLHQNLEVFKEFPDYLVNKTQYLMDEEVASISITSPDPELLNGVDMEKIKVANFISNQKLEKYQEFMMASKVQWCVVAYPTDKWAKKVYPNLDVEKAKEKLLDDIMSACRVTDENDAVKDFNEHMERLEENAKKLNDLNFEYLHFKNKLGTDLVVYLVQNHVWAGGGEKGQNGVYFAANIPTEEIFTMPNKNKVEGIVYSTKPLVYQGNIIKDFYLEFKNGVVVNFDAKEGKENLKMLLETDSGSKRLGEVALVSYDSPISKMNVLFYNTLFDENASCHLALGEAYPMNLKDFNKYSSEELDKIGYNKSLNHEDFMFGSSDLEVIGYKKNGESIKLFENGNFIKL